jgi:O-antigen/teichoic acid export membrane protein/aminoglycoside phosphotransferase
VNVGIGVLSDRVGRARDGVVERWRVPSLRNGYALVASTLVTSALGALYWILAARKYDADSVGLNASLISAMWFLTNLAHLNLTNALNRFVPTAGSRTRRFVSLSYSTAAGLSVVAAGIFVLGVRWWSDALDEVREHPWLGIAFVASTLVWTIFVLQDSVLAGLQEGTYVLVENAIYGVAKIALLIAIASAAPNRGIFLSWVAPLPFLVIGVNVIVFKYLLPRQDHPLVEEVPDRATLARFVAADYGAGLLWTAATSLLPILVLATSGSKASAYAFTSWTIAYTLYLVSRSMGIANTTAGAREPHRLADLTRRTLLETARLIVPAIVLLVAFAPQILSVFGEDYAEGGTALLRLFSLSAIPYLITATFVSVSYVPRRMRAVFVTMSSLAVTTVVLAIVLLHAMGINGVGVAWLIAQTVVAVALLLTEFRSLWVSRVNIRPVEPLLSGARSFVASRRRPALVQRAEALLASEPKLAHLTLDRPLTTIHDVDLAVVRNGDDGSRALLRMPTTASGARTVVQHTGVLLKLEDRPLGPCAPLLPRVLGEDLTGASPWMVESFLEGTPALDLLDDLGAERLVELTVDTVQPLHGHALEHVVVDEQLLRKWVDEPIDRLRAVPGPALYRHRDNAAYEHLRAELYDALDGKEVAAGLVHGDLWLGNVLVDPKRGEVCGLIDWDFAHEPAIVHADVMHLLIATRSAQTRMELGEVVVRGLAGEEWLPYELAALERTAGVGGSELSHRTLLLLAWLNHVSGLPDKSDRYKTSWLWRARNTELVLEQL